MPKGEELKWSLEFQIPLFVAKPFQATLGYTFHHILRKNY